MNEFVLNRSRLDYMLIWGHGLSVSNEILNFIGSQSWCNIQKIIHHKPESIQSLVERVYSYDYAPFEHLQGKVRYLLSTPAEVLFVFFLNEQPDEDFYAEGEYRHVESLSIRKLKTEIRERFNPRVNNMKTEDHVVHFSDNEAQTDYILKYLNYKEGIHELRSSSTKILKVPVHLGPFEKLTIKQVDINDLYCNIIFGKGESFTTSIVKLEDSPHFKGLFDNFKTYEEYVNGNLGFTLLDYYSVEKFKKLEKRFEYLKEPYQLDFIVVKENDNGTYRIQDGLHRAAILKKQNVNQLNVLIKS